MPVSDAALGQIVGREFQGNFVAIHDLDAIAAESSRHGREHGSAGVEFDGKHTRFELFNDLAHYFDCVFFWQMIVILPLNSIGYRTRGKGRHCASTALPQELVAAVATSAAAKPTTAATAALRLGTRFVDVQGAAVQVG